MKCPSCNIRLMPANRGQVAIDFCPKCWGVWLDRGELDMIIRQSRMDEARDVALSRSSTVTGVYRAPARPN